MDILAKITDTTPKLVKEYWRKHIDLYNIPYGKTKSIVTLENLDEFLLFCYMYYESKAIK